MFAKTIIILTIAIFFIAYLMPVANKSDSKPSKKETWQCFFIGLVGAALITPAFYNLVIIPVGIWFLLFAGGLVPWWSKYKKAFAYQWGIFFGITIGLAAIFEYLQGGI
ncbi:hypothetical protein [Litorilituus sediminis]|uniref:Uncharacterized protein n=1 Tax=Litorilituus sediminis TaxID=718192 RepID=A0A4P6P798_9GAMM|nr:hypothetical protein [Litorilituus sediminis]QBG37531.1 hypothetical protein EMK97_18210 [Litorilituus sediminis]